MSRIREDEALAELVIIREHVLCLLFDPLKQAAVAHKDNKAASELRRLAEVGSACIHRARCP